MRRVNTLILSTVSATALLASPAFAQTAPADQSPPEAAATEQQIESGQDAQVDANAQPADANVQPAAATPADSSTIVVTGSRIRRPNLTSPLPVTSIGGEEFFQTGNVSIGDKLSELPSITPTFNQSNSTRGLGTSGLNILDLRGLGILRTLVLVNGRRHVGGDILLTGVSVDTNTIPADLIDRVDVVTGGNSAVYGSDAIAGVVNFILKDNYEGLQLRAQGGTSRYHDSDAFFVSGLAGTNFADGRGNAAVNVEYARRNQSFGDSRKWFRENYALADSDPSGTANGSDGVPDLVFNPDFRSATFSNTGTIRFGGPGTSLTCGLDANGGFLTCPFIFQPDGSLIPQTGTRLGIGPNGQFIGGNGEDFVHDRQIQITPQLDRFNVNLVSHFEITPALVPFVEATYSRTKSVGTGASGPAFIAAGQAFFDPFQFVGGFDRERISIDNPYLTPATRQLIIDQRALSGLTTPSGTRLGVQQGLLGLGNRTEEATRQTYRIVGGLRGDLGSNWSYEGSLNYGQMDEKTKIKGNLDVQRMLLAMDAVRDPTSGNIVCRSQIDPSAASGYYPSYYYNYYGPNDPRSDPNAPARLANDIAQCTPVNVLGGNFTQAQKDYLLLDTTSSGTTKQFDALAFISGDSSKWFELPGGPIGIVLGAEYRTQDLGYDQDPQVQLGYTFYNKLPTFDAPTQRVKEAFGEVRIPIVKDLPFLNELEVSAAARVSNYNIGDIGTVWAYNGNLVWSPVKGLRLRGNYARSVRAPNQVELFTPFGQNFALINDPCDVNQVGAGTENRAANCIAAGIPAGTAIPYSSSISFLSGGNENLQEETSTSITLGGVFTPTFLPGFSASVDYYNVKVKNVIQALGAQTVLDSCYDLPSLSNPFCALFQRGNPGGGHGGVPFAIVDGTLRSAPVNFARLVTRGIDTEIAYRGQIGRLGRFDTKLIWTHVLEGTNFIDPTNPTFGDRFLSELGAPEDRFNWDSSLKAGRFTFGYGLRYVGKSIKYSESRGVGEYEDFFSFEGRDPQNADLFDSPWFKAKIYHDVRAAIDIGPKYNFYLGVDNLTDVRPPPTVTGLGAFSGLYDVIGRFMYAGVSAKF